MIHIINGEQAAIQLKAAFELDENLRGEVVVLNDHLSIGPIQVEDAQNHDPVRSEFWRMISLHHNSHKMTDRETILATIEQALNEEEPMCFWLSPCANDVCTYYWLLTFFVSITEVLHTINIIGLPFLNEKGQLFYPKNFTEVIPSEFIKTKRLLKKVTPAEFEVEGDEWSKLQSELSWVRWYEGGKKITSKDLTAFDATIQSTISNEYQKGQKVVNDVIKKSTQDISPFYIEWRLRELIRLEKVTVNGDPSKTIKDFEVKKVGELVFPESTDAAEA